MLIVTTAQYFPFVIRKNLFTNFLRSILPKGVPCRKEIESSKATFHRLRHPDLNFDRKIIVRIVLDILSVSIGLFLVPIISVSPTFSPWGNVIKPFTPVSYNFSL
jgi:hypothetical protein